jgi:hypothetical protein
MKKLLKISLLLVSVIFLSFTSFKSRGNKTEHKVQITNESNFNILIVNKNHMKFGVSTKKPTKSDFYTNSNFFTNKSAIGLVVVNGKRIN